ncbi:MAG: hypothetical protein V4697_02850 [Patescibacteria group bacterium]
MKTNSNFGPDFVKQHGCPIFNIHGPFPLLGGAYTLSAIILRKGVEEVLVVKSEAEYTALQGGAVPPADHYKILGLYSVRILQVPLELLH